MVSLLPLMVECIRTVKVSMLPAAVHASYWVSDDENLLQLLVIYYGGLACSADCAGGLLLDADGESTTAAVLSWGI